MQSFELFKFPGEFGELGTDGLFFLLLQLQCSGVEALFILKGILGISYCGLSEFSHSLELRLTRFG
jgi:hypothetical protein